MRSLVYTRLHHTATVAVEDGNANSLWARKLLSSQGSNWDGLVSRGGAQVVSHKRLTIARRELNARGLTHFRAWFKMRSAWVSACRVRGICDLDLNQVHSGATSSGPKNDSLLTTVSQDRLGHSKRCLHRFFGDSSHSGLQIESSACSDSFRDVGARHL